MSTPPPRSYLFLIQFKTEQDIETDGARIRAEDLQAAITNALEEKSRRNPNRLLRVVLVKEIPEG